MKNSKKCHCTVEVTVETPLTLAFSTAASITVSCPTTMILCGWIVLILQVQSVFNCPPSYDDPCCPGKFCCNDGLNGCCNDNRQFYVPELSAYTVGDHECVCWPSRRSSGMCHFNLKMNLVNIVLLIQFWSHLWKPTGATGENGSTVLKVNMWWAWEWRLRAIRE